MIKRIVVAGSRNYNDYDKAKEYIDLCISEIKNKYTLIFLSGGCRGADMLGERYADKKGFKVERYPAEWQKFGKEAGPKRNKQMAKSMIEYAKQNRKPIRIKLITE